jgi:hypothetical protein
MFRSLFSVLQWERQGNGRWALLASSTFGLRLTPLVPDSHGLLGDCLPFPAALQRQDANSATGRCCATLLTFSAS